MIFRGGLFFWEGQAPILRESYRVLKAGGVAVMGGALAPKLPTSSSKPGSLRYGN